mgnify:CR=1 FL=1
MKFLWVYLVGFVIFIAAILFGLGKAGVLSQIGTTWTIIGVLAAVGVAVMAAVGAASRGNISINK